MKNSDRTQSATSLPRAPRDSVGARSNRYLLMMGVRILCFILMVAITPYGWYTWVLGAAAIFLPYIAVVSANVGEEARSNRREDPKPALTAAPAPGPIEQVHDEHPVLRMQEAPGTATAAERSSNDAPENPAEGDAPATGPSEKP